MFEILFWLLISQAGQSELPTASGSTTEELPVVDEAPVTPSAPVEAQPAPAPTTNSGEVFRDPFAPNAQPPVQANPSAPLSVPQDFGAPTRDLTPSSVGPTQSEGGLPSESGRSSEPQFEELNPLSPANQPKPMVEPIQAPKKEFHFPDLEEFKGPVTQDVAMSERNYLGTPEGSWNVGFGVGMGVNVNRRHEQVHFEGMGGYRAWKNYEVGGILSYRFIKDKLLGLIFTGKGLWRVTPVSSMRIDIGGGLGLGWTLRARSNTFSEGRFTTRAQGDGVFYIHPTVAIISSIALESFLFNLTTDGDANNLMSDGGAPTQMILTAGMRWEY